jgi:uncharacterized protein YgiM (DUF1202 family)
MKGNEIMGKNRSIIKVLLLTFIISVSSVGYAFSIGQGITKVAAATTTTKSNEVSCKKTRYVTATSLNVRKSGSAKAKKVTTLKYRDKVTMIATITDSSWVKIKTSSGKVGYVNKKYLSSTKPAKKSNDTTNNGGVTNNSGGGTSNNSDDAETPSKPPQSPDDVNDGHF